MTQGVARFYSRPQSGTRAETTKMRDAATVDDSWANAKANARPDCPRCHGLGTYMYDHNHDTICNLCCKHNMGW